MLGTRGGGRAGRGALGPAGRGAPAPGPLPLDHPTTERPHRLYFALTNRCNRSCPWCSTCSTPSGGTFLSLEDFRAAFPREGEFQVQLEGGEPTVHPRFWDFVRAAREHPRCTHLVVCTNGLLLPRSSRRLRAWLARLGAPATVKISVNHHLLERDGGLLVLCQALRDEMRAGRGGAGDSPPPRGAGTPGAGTPGAGLQLVVNVRLRRGYDEDDRRVREAVERAGLLPHANVFFLQSYGFARDEAGWEPPRPVSDRFTLVNPDGRLFGPDLVRRSEAMRGLP